MSDGKVSSEIRGKKVSMKSKASNVCDEETYNEPKIVSRRLEQRE